MPRKGWGTRIVLLSCYACWAWVVVAQSQSVQGQGGGQKQRPFPQRQALGAQEQVWVGVAASVF
ncbi:MAG TPA: hypothetical protein VFT88_12515 [Acidobacteriaceae bacterium]|nr:hypothetical protein [Acidobacteriaceae bacterium]